MLAPVILDATRTALGRRGGALSSTHPVDLLGLVLRRIVSLVPASEIDDVICGCVTQAGEQSTNIGRNAWLAGGLPEHVPAVTIDRQCGSSQQAIDFAVQAIASGQQELVIACGIEHMTRVPMGSNSEGPGDINSPGIRRRYPGGLIHQGIAAEMMTKRWGLSRQSLDGFAVRSHLQARDATERGLFKQEILPLETDDMTETFLADEGIREPNWERISHLPPAFDKDGVITAANSSQISDGAAAVLIASEQKARELGVQPLARFVDSAVMGSDPILMLDGPILATQKVLTRAGLDLRDIDLVEINEAFACVVLAWQKELSISDSWLEDHVNVHGGAIALGHPLGASGARLMTTLLHGLKTRDARFGLQTMCEGGGLANATIVERIADK